MTGWIHACHVRFICYLRLYGHFLVEKFVGLKYLRICNHSREAVFFKSHTFYLTVVTLMIFYEFSITSFRFLNFWINLAVPLERIISLIRELFTSNYLEPGWSIEITIHF